MTDEKRKPYEIELDGKKAGINPMFGEWIDTFRIAPVPHGDGGTKVRAFQTAIRDQLKSIGWLYSHEVKLTITLYVDVQTVLETSETADLDNYAKAILDGLKGPGGIMIDDTQVQALDIAWIDHHDPAWFEVEAKASPDEFLQKPVEFYEMPDTLWYPVSRRFWTTNGVEVMNDLNFYFLIGAIEVFASFKKRLRAALRNAGSDRLQAYRATLPWASPRRGFHRSRLDDDFTRHAIKAWQAERETWRQTETETAAKVDELLKGLREGFDKLVAEASNN